MLQVAVQEVRRMQKYGVTASELANFQTAALPRDVKHMEEAEGSMFSVDLLNFCMEALALDHTLIFAELGVLLLILAATFATCCRGSLLGLLLEHRPNMHLVKCCLLVSSATPTYVPSDPASS